MPLGGKTVPAAGLSTASAVTHQVYDFHYTGAVILPPDITDHAVISHAAYQQALERICLTAK